MQLPRNRSRWRVETLLHAGLFSCNPLSRSGPHRLLGPDMEPDLASHDSEPFGKVVRLFFFFDHGHTQSKIRRVEAFEGGTRKIARSLPSGRAKTPWEQDHCRSAFAQLAVASPLRDGGASGRAPPSKQSFGSEPSEIRGPPFDSVGRAGPCLLQSSTPGAVAVPSTITPPT